MYVEEIPLTASSNLWLTGFQNWRWCLFLVPLVGFFFYEFVQSVFEAMCTCSIHNILWLSVVRLKHILCGKNTSFSLFLNFLPARFMPCLLILVLEGTVKKRIHVLWGLWLGNFLFYLPSLSCNFSREVLEINDSVLFIVLAVFFVTFAGLFLMKIVVQGSEEQGWGTITGSGYSISAYDTL